MSHCAPAMADFPCVKPISIDFTAPAEAFAWPPPGQNAATTMVRGLPSLSELGYALAWKASTSCGAMGVSLNHKVTLRYGSTRNATAQWFRENFSPAMTPVAVHFACA